MLEFNQSENAFHFTEYTVKSFPFGKSYEAKFPKCLFFQTILKFFSKQII